MPVGASSIRDNDDVSRFRIFPFRSRRIGGRICPMTATRLLQSTLFALVISSIPVLAQTPATGTAPPSPALAQAQEQLRSGQLDQALAAYQQALASTPDSAEANQGAGIALD